MNKIYALFLMMLLSGCETLNDHPKVMNDFIKSGNCKEAEEYAYRNFRAEYLDWMLGNVALECHKDRKKAIQYYRAGARPNERYSDLSVRSLIEMGETPPEQTTRYITTPTPAQQPQQIIIQQQAPAVKGGVCIQDGGGTFCPNHPNSKFIPVYK